MDFQTNGTAEGTLLYQYDPSSAAAGIFIAVFGIATLVHFVEMIVWRAGFMLPLVIGCIMSCFGYYGRFWASHDRHNFGAFVLQSFLLVLAPVFFSASVYMAVARDAVSLDAAKLSVVSPRWFAKLFVSMDVVLFLVQIAALGLQVTTSASMQATGRTVLVIGLAVQCAVTAFFTLSASVLHARLRNRVLGNVPTGIPWKSHMRSLIAVGFLLLIRNIFRSVEYAQGFGGAISKHEAFLYIFDAVPMLCLVALAAFYHPGRLRKLVQGCKTAVPMAQQSDA